MVNSIPQNFTCKGWTWTPTGKDILKAVVIVCVSLGIVVGNIFSVVVFNSGFTKNAFLKKIRLTMNSLICTDLSMGLLMCPFCVYSALYHCWPFGEIFCKVEALLISALFHESTLSLVLIALDRYFSVHHYLKYNSLMSSRKYVTVIVSTWIVVFSTYAFVIFSAEQFYFDEIGVNCEPYYVNTSVTITVISFFYILPAILFVFSYGSIFYTANRRQTSLRHVTRQQVGTAKQSAVSQILKTSKYLAAISLGFFIAVTPWTLCTVVVAVTGIELNEDVDFAVTWLAISNSFWNVVIYSVMNRKFRAAAVGLLTKGRRFRWIKRGLGSKLVDADSHNTMAGHRGDNGENPSETARELQENPMRCFRDSTFSLVGIESPQFVRHSDMSYNLSSIFP